MYLSRTEYNNITDENDKLREENSRLRKQLEKYTNTTTVDKNIDDSKILITQSQVFSGLSPISVATNNIGSFKTYNDIDTNPPTTPVNVEKLFIPPNKSRGRLIYMEVTQGFKGINTHNDIENKAVGGSEHQMLNLIKHLSNTNQKDIYSFKDISHTQKVDNVTYLSNKGFLDFELNDEDIIIIQRFILHDPRFTEKIQNNKVVVWIHDLSSMVTFVQERDMVDFYENNLEQFKRYLLRYFINRDNLYFVFPSEFSKNDFKRFINQFCLSIPDHRLMVIGHILYEDEFKIVMNKKIDVDKNRIVFASSWSKNIQKVIDLFEYIHKKNKSYVLYFMEHGWDREKNYERKMKEKFGDHVHILGPQTKEKYAEIVKSGLCVISSTFRETFGCVFTESYYLGTPVIADYRSGAVCENIDKDYVMDYDEPEEVYQKIEYLKQNRENIHVKLPNKFFFDSVFNKWLDLFEMSGKRNTP